MRKLLTGIGFALFLAGSSVAQLHVTEVMSSSAHGGGTNNGDWFELTYSGVGTFDLNGWSWDDNSNLSGSATFGSVTSIAAGQSIIFTQETVGAEAAWISDWGLTGVTVVNLGSTIFQNFSATGDEIHIYNNLGVEQTSAGVVFGTATDGFSFAWDTAGNSLGLSVAGQNGAFM
ncbi:MAG: lamin tail domain-containing protein, partial [Chthoniobacterales bacterium]